jgi:hypothetical protein
MIQGTRSLIIVAVLLAFVASAWAADVSAVQGEATYKEAPKFDVAKKTVAFGGVEYKWADLIGLKLRAALDQPKSGYKIFSRNGDILYADIVTAQQADGAATIVLKIKSAFLGPEAAFVSTNNAAGVQSLNPKVYREIALRRLQRQANAATFRKIDFNGKPMDADDLQKLFEKEPDKFAEEGKKDFARVSALLEGLMLNKENWDFDFYYGIDNDKSQKHGVIQGIAPNLDVTFVTKAGSKYGPTNLYDMVGVSFKAVNKPTGFGDKPYVKVIGAHGDVITGEIAGEKDGMIAVKTDVNDVIVRVAESEISEMVFRNGDFTFLSDLPDGAVKAVEYPEFCAPDTTKNDSFPWQRDRSTMDGRPPLKLNGRIYHKGIGVHSFSDLTFNIGGEYKKFKATVGIDDDVPGKPGGNVTFEIRGDGKILFAKTTVKSGDKPLAIAVDVSGVKSLEIIVDFGEGGHQNDHCDIVNAILVK